jgi:hypothetical protein
MKGRESMAKRVKLDYADLKLTGDEPNIRQALVLADAFNTITKGAAVAAAAPAPAPTVPGFDLNKILAQLPTIIALIQLLAQLKDQLFPAGQPAAPGVPAAPAVPAPTPTVPDRPVPTEPDEEDQEDEGRIVASARFKDWYFVEDNKIVGAASRARKLARKEALVPGTRRKLDFSPIDQFGREIGPPGDDETQHALLAKLMLMPDGVTPRVSYRVEGGIGNITQGEHWSNGKRTYGCTPSQKIGRDAPSGESETGEVYADYVAPDGRRLTFGPLPSLIVKRAGE